MEDLAAVFALNRACFDPCWSEQSLHGALEAGYDLLLCEQNGELAAYLLTLTLLDETQIMQVAVAKQFRRQGLAELMSRHLIDSCSGISKILLEVRRSNRAAQALYAKLGFQQNGERRHYYAPDQNGQREDALLMALQLE